MTAQELRKLIEEKEQKFAVSGSSLPASAQAVIKKQISDMKSQLETLEKAEKDVKSAEKTDDEKKIEKAEQKLEDKEKKVESKVESAEKEIKKTVKKGMTEAQKRAAEKYRQKQKEKKEAEKKKKEAAEKKKKRAKKTTKVEAKAKRKPAQKSAPKKSAPKKSAPKSKRKKRATKKDTISSFLAKNKTARQKYKGVSMASKKRDADVPAKPFGYRLAGTNRRPTKAEIKAGKAYWEGRPTKADVRRTGYPKLAEGGFLDDKIIGSPNDPELLAGGNYFKKGGEAKGGGFFNLGGDGRGNRTHHNEGRAWTLDRNQHNKSEDYEIPLRNRKHKKKNSMRGGR